MAFFILFSSFPLLLASLMHISKYLELYIQCISEYSFQTIKNLPLQISDVHMSRFFFNSLVNYLGGKLIQNLLAKGQSVCLCVCV